jgi:CubicO group peptidase (beta-lactamase class C family)
VSAAAGHTLVERLRTYLAEEVASGRILGGVAHCRDVGRDRRWSVLVGRDARHGPPVSDDSVVRLYSMTKPLLAVLTLRLVDLGLLPGLDVPVAELADGLDGVRVDPRMTVRHLLTMTSGLAGAKFADERMRRIYEAAGVLPFDYTERAYRTDETDFLRRIFRCPLSAAPGRQWEYGRSADVLGLLLQHHLRTPVDALFTRHLFAPLGMTSSGFFLPPDRAPATVLQPPADPPTGERLAALTRPAGFRSAGSGGLASPADYARFLEAVFFPAPRTPLLSPDARAELLTDQIAGLHDTGPDYIPGSGWGFSLNFGITPRNSRPADARRLAWLGRCGTSFIVDLKDQRIMTFAAPCFGRPRELQAAFSDIVDTSGSPERPKEPTR